MPSFDSAFTSDNAEAFSLSSIRAFDQRVGVHTGGSID